MQLYDHILGSLGIKLNPHKDTGRAIIVRVNPGSQGEKHPQLCAGLLIQQVGATDVSNMVYSGVLGVIKASKQRPLTLTFAVPLGEHAAQPKHHAGAELRVAPAAREQA